MIGEYPVPFQVVLEPSDPAYDAVVEAVATAASDREPITLNVTEPWFEKVFTPGDKVRVPFDDGYGPAVVDHCSVSGGIRYVTVTYGPGGKYRTSLHPSSITTSNMIEHPAEVKP